MIKLPSTDRRANEFAESFANNIADLIPAKLGNPSTNEVSITDVDREGLVYIHGLGKDPQSAQPAVNNLPFATKFLVYGTPIKVKREVNGYVVKEFDNDNFALFFKGVTNHDQNPVNLSQIMYGTIQPTSPQSYQVRVIPAVYTDSDTSYRVGDLLSADFSASPLDTLGAPINIPTNNTRAIGVLIQLDVVAKTLSYKQGAQFDNSLSHSTAFDNGYYPAFDSGKFRVGWVRLVSGMLTLGYENIFNAPNLLTSGGSGYFPIDITSPIVIPANKQIVVGGYTVSTGGSILVNGRLKVV